MGGDGYGKSGHLYIFTSLKHLMMLLKLTNFSGFHFYTIPQIHVFRASTAKQLRFLQVEILLNNAFNIRQTLRLRADSKEDLGLYCICCQSTL